MPQKVTQTAQLQCDKGTKPSELKVTSQDFSTFEDKFIATEKDALPNQNILPFGSCSLKYNQPCTPQTQKWDKTTQNDKTARKIQKFVLVPIKTNHDGLGEIIGTFKPTEKINLCRALHQALVVPILEEPPYILNLAKHPDFQVRTIKGVKHYGKYIDPATETINKDVPSFFAHSQSLCFKAKYKGTAVFDKYKSGYFTVFSLGAPINGSAIGQIASEEYTVGSKTVTRFLKNLFLFINRDDCTMNHEGLHGFNLKHTHRDTIPIEDPEVKYIFPNAIASSLQPTADPTNSTDNVMCYRSIAFTTWHWQWTILRRNV